MMQKSFTVSFTPTAKEVDSEVHDSQSSKELMCFNVNSSIELGTSLEGASCTCNSVGKVSDVFSLAKAFLSISKMTNKKLQKLCYYSKAWYLALYDCNLISEPFEAWVHGAVQPLLYEKYKEYGYSEIPMCKNMAQVPEEFISFAREIYNSYGHLTGDDLEQLNHQETPWIKARGTCKPWEKCNTEISEDDMKVFYRGLMMNGENS